MNPGSGADTDHHTQADREFHAATAHVYEDVLLPIFGPYVDLVIRPSLDSLAAKAPGREAADVGCGTGLVTVELAARGFRVRGIDHSPEMLSYAHSRIDRDGYADRVELVTGDVRQLPWDDASIDLLTCQGVLHHLTELDQTVAECARVLRPGGRFFISEPCVGSTAALRAWERMKGLRRRLRRGTPAAPPPGLEIPGHDEGPIDAEGLARLLDSHGLETQIDYWTHFEGSHRLPAPAARALIRWGSRPWRDRSGNLAYLTGFKRPSPEA
ncbi:MAG TPA: methyltransferase domain-containing protein [Thermoleophilaceae bacterium]|nr:methyltransferase domain-containing protein [Thermoleophilaceae bacterium]